MTEAAHCPKCGLILAPNAPRGLCPGCLFIGALETQTLMADGDHDADGIIDLPPTPQELASDFPDLEILRFVGRGGMGMVYQARQKQLDRIVALKILSPKIARDSAFAERFAREARMMALLTHPHVVTVYEFGMVPATEAGDRDVPLYYLLMEFVDGLTLRQLVDAGQLTAPQSLAIVPQICDALQYAHDKGVVHRDIKPENILLDRNGNLKIADFGLAKLMGLQGHDITISATGQVLGTLCYMAPEQMERPLDVDHRADIYSLGVVFYQMLTGELPLGRFSPPSRRVLIDVRLDDVVMRALEKEPERRYQQASALRSQIETISMTPSSESLNAALTKSPQPPLLSRLKGHSRLSRMLIALAQYCAVAGLVTYVAMMSLRSLQPPVKSSADSPHDLRSASTSRVIEAGIEKPISPWAWQELEGRSLEPDDANVIMNRLTEWIRREHPKGMSQPLSWLDHSLTKLDERKLVSDQLKIDFLEALNGQIRGHQVYRLHEGTRRLDLYLNWRRVWDRELLGMVLLNEAQSISVDGKPAAFLNESSNVNWDSPHILQSIQLPALTPGKHAIRLEVLSAFVLKEDLVGLNTNARSADWPPAKKRWTRSMDIEVVVLPEGAENIGETQDPTLRPESAVFDIESIIVRREGVKTRAVLSFKIEPQSLLVPMSFDVALQIGGQTIPCGSMWAAKTQKGTSSAGSILNVEIPELDAGTGEADVVLTPNRKWIELQPDVDHIWGKEIVFRRVVLRRLDLADPISGSVQTQTP